LGISIPPRFAEIEFPEVALEEGKDEDDPEEDTGGGEIAADQVSVLAQGPTEQLQGDVKAEADAEELVHEAEVDAGAALEDAPEGHGDDVDERGGETIPQPVWPEERSGASREASPRRK